MRTEVLLLGFPRPIEMWISNTISPSPRPAYGKAGLGILPVSLTHSSLITSNER